MLMVFTTLLLFIIRLLMALLIGRSVQSFKQGLKKMQGETLPLKLARYLFRYRITPHSTTAELLMGRRPRLVLDLVHPDPVQRVENHNSSNWLGKSSI